MEWIWAGFGMGLLGSFHCAGMCGPIALAIPFSTQNKAQHFAGNVFYQLGRITSYAFIGLIFGWIGRGFSIAGLQQPLSIVLGTFMIAAILLPKVFHLHRSPKPLQKAVLWVKKKLGKLLQQKSYQALFSTGILNGFLPCGLVYMALLGALGIGAPIKSAAFMAMFGFGTFPMMFAIAFSGQIITQKWRTRFTKVVPYFVVLLGLLFVLRGMGIGIKYISPPTESLQIEATKNCH